MTNFSYFIALLLVCLMGTAQANPREQYVLDQREAATHYAEDKAICADERNQGQRMKCLRIAKNEHARAMAEAKSRLDARRDKRGMACRDCGKVTAVNVGQKRGESNALGVIAGGAAGALLGNQIGGGSGKTVATIAGAVGGAYAGKKIQESSTSSQVWNVEVQYDNGQRRTFSFEHDPGLRRGDSVKNSGASIMRI